MNTESHDASWPTELRARPVVFLDIDDVLCLNDPFSGFDLIRALRRRRTDREAVIAKIFDADALTTMAALERAAGPLRYVISSSWRLEMTREELHSVFAATGLNSVAASIREDTAWATPEVRGGSRADDIGAWLAQHHRGTPFLILDDEGSGQGLREFRVDGGTVLLCHVGVGLQLGHLPAMLRALETRSERLD